MVIQVAHTYRDTKSGGLHDKYIIINSAFWCWDYKDIIMNKAEHSLSSTLNRQSENTTYERRARYAMDQS